MNSNLSILFVIENLENGGQEKQLLLLCEALLNFKIKVAIYINRFDELDFHYPNFKKTGIPLYHTNEKNYIAKLCYLYRLTTITKPDFIQSFTFHLNTLCWLASIGNKPIAIGAIRSLPAYNMKVAGIRKAIPNMLLPEILISNNQTGANQIKNILPAKKIIVVPNGMQTIDAITKQDYQLGTEIRTISVGRISEEKRIDKLVDIVHSLNKQNLPIVHHHYGNGPLQQEITGRIEMCKLEKQFVLKGSSDKVGEILPHYDIFIHTASIEGTPNVILEAMMAGLPVVTSNCGDVSYIINNHEDGIICMDDINKTFEIEISNLIAHADLRLRIGTQARKRIEQKYTIEKYANNMLHAYESILQSI